MLNAGKNRLYFKGKVSLFFYFVYLNQNYESKYETNNTNMGKQMYNTKSQCNRTFSKKGREKDNSSKNTKKRYQKYTVFSYMNILTFFRLLF